MEGHQVSLYLRISCVIAGSSAKGKCGEDPLYKIIKELPGRDSSALHQGGALCGCAGPRVTTLLALFSEGRTERQALTCAGYSLYSATDIPQNAESSWTAVAFLRFPSRLRQWKNLMWQIQSLPSISSSIWQTQGPTHRISSSVPGASPPPWPWSTWAPGAILQTR